MCLCVCESVSVCVFECVCVRERERGARAFQYHRIECVRERERNSVCERQHTGFKLHQGSMGRLRAKREQLSLERCTDFYLNAFGCDSHAEFARQRPVSMEVYINFTDTCLPPKT